MKSNPKKYIGLEVFHLLRGAIIKHKSNKTTRCTMNFAVTALNDWKSYPLFASLRYSTQVHNKCSPLEGQHNESYVSILLSIYPFLSHDFHTCYSLNSFLPLPIHTANTSSLCPNSDWFSFCFVRGDRRITTWLWAWLNNFEDTFSVLGTCYYYSLASVCLNLLTSVDVHFQPFQFPYSLVTSF